jgi:GTP cyclohydrolase I
MKENILHAVNLDVGQEDDFMQILPKASHNQKSKIDFIEMRFREIMEILELDLTDGSLRDTPARVAKMYVKEIFSGLDPENKPEITLFENKFNYHEMIVVNHITFHSVCEHHFVPIIGKASVAYIPGEYIIGLSKINRLVQYYAKRPQVQERLTMQIADEIKQSLQTEDVAVAIEAHHLCVAMRGVHDTNSKTVTSCYYGKFNDELTKKELIKQLGQI